MMVQSQLAPCSPASKTDEILSRYRPIAPKPELPPPSTGGGAVEESPHNLKHSPYLRNIWAHLQARPTRTRKRGRSSLTPSLLKRHLQGAPPSTDSPFLGLCYPPPLGYPFKQNMITLPLLSSSPPTSSSSPTTPTKFMSCMGLEEKDLVLQLKSPSPIAPRAVVAPKAVRPVGSTIKVGPMSMEGSSLREAVVVVMGREEVEAVAEVEVLPVLISDSRNRVRMANSAYREMVGQPECGWLDELMGGCTGRRIGGEVVIQIPASVSELPAGGFSCWARIEWGGGDQQGLVDAICDVATLNCVSNDYLFRWRFHTRR